jgi:hypothetical protein
MAVIYVRTFETAGGTEVPASGLRTGSAEAAADQAIRLNQSYSPPAYVTKIFYSGDFTDPAFAELTQLVQQHGLNLEIGGA